ncbi:MAG: phosphoribosylformylglycinamidine synthase subunit PurQ [Verrucomicrobiota bacterium]
MTEHALKKKVKVLVVTGYGLNCERETSRAFQEAGATVKLQHLNDILADDKSLAPYHILAFIGGFSFGDHISAGTVFANRLKCRMQDQLADFIRAGKLVIGICNGFQTLTRLGLVPAGKEALFQQEVALAENTQGVFRDDWVTVKVNPESPCVFTRGIDYLDLPVRHGEGRFIARDEEVYRRLEDDHLLTLQYAHPETGAPTMDFPYNPNGSENSIAGICDRSGRLFGLMPHPEAFLSAYNHPHWQDLKRRGQFSEKGGGQAIFDNAVEYAVEELL